jgi:hypothetical protein
MKDRTPRPTSLQRIAKKADSQKGYRFRNLYGRRDEDFLKQCWRDIRFECLGFEYRWGKDHKGQDPLKRRTARKKLRPSWKRFTAWCQENRPLRLLVLFKRWNAKLRGSYNNYGVHGNAASLKKFFNLAHDLAQQLLLAP